MTTAAKNTMSTRTFGVEIEAVGATRGAVATALRRAGIDCYDAGYSHTAVASWKVVSDVSVAGSLPFELVSPILRGDAGLEQIATVCRVLNELGCTVNSSCGLHVHVDGRDFSQNLNKIKNLARMWMKYETCFDQLVPASRRDNHYCNSNLRRHGSVADAFQAIGAVTTLHSLLMVTNRAADDNGRYHKLNLCALLRHGTVEFRQHGGTTEAEKIINWVRLVVDFADEAANATRISPAGAGDLNRLLANTKDRKARAFFRARQAALAATRA
jgi:hypothetical protein